MTVHLLARVPAQQTTRRAMPSDVRSRHLGDLGGGDRAWLPALSSMGDLHWIGPVVVRRCVAIPSTSKLLPVVYLVEWLPWGPEDTKPYLLINELLTVMSGAWVLPGGVDAFRGRGELTGNR